jgi:hypothetical protein
LKRFIDQNKILPSRFINIRLAGDSTVLNKPTVKILNFTFSIINDKKYNKTSKGNYLLGSFIIKDENQSLDLKKRPNFSKFLKFLEDIDITNPYYNSDKQIKLRSMNGDYIGKILT